MLHQDIDDASFARKVLDSTLPVAVLFCGPWCRLCDKAGPLMDDVARSYAGKVKVAKIDLDRNRRTAKRFGIRALPALLLFKRGRLVDAILGLRPKAEIRQMLDGLLTA